MKTEKVIHLETPYCPDKHIDVRLTARYWVPIFSLSCLTIPHPYLPLFMISISGLTLRAAGLIVNYPQPFAAIHTTHYSLFGTILTIRNYLLFGFSGHIPPGWNASPSGHVQDMCVM